MDTDFIKWLCDKCDFEIVSMGGEEKIWLRVGHSSVITQYLFSDHFKNIWHPLLLQRAIEGVNSTSETWAIEIKMHGIEAWEVDDRDRTFENFHYGLNTTIDSAKESALRYVYEQEDKKE